MKTFNWCHGPECHEKVTTDRVRGVKGHKVLRTRKIPIHNWNEDHYFRFFCRLITYTKFIFVFVII